MAAIRICSAENVWFSHGHPDHLNGDSLALLRDRRILLPAHAEGRIRRDFETGGYQVRELPIADWVPLPKRIRIMCLPDYNQDAALLIEIGNAPTLNGKWPVSNLYPDFSPYVAKHSDSGRARTTEELRAYFGEYRRRTGAFAFLRHLFAARASQVVRATLEADSPSYRLTRRVYWKLKSLG